MKATITYATTNEDGTVDYSSSFFVAYEGFDSMFHAEHFAWTEAARLSSLKGKWITMCNISVDSDNFVCECSPCYYRETVRSRYQQMEP